MTTSQCQMLSEPIVLSPQTIPRRPAGAPLAYTNQIGT
jgi:hypothetical protein